MFLSDIAQKIRRMVVEMLAEAGSGHTGGSLGMADVFTALYFGERLNLDPKNPDDPLRDRVILSNGHICPVWYATLALRGYFPVEELKTLRKLGSRLQGHPHWIAYSNPINDKFQITNTKPSFVKGYGRAQQNLYSAHNLPGVENNAGPLGQGMSFAVGQTLGLRYLFKQGKLEKLPRVICLTGDGELNEGQCWEALMSASKFKLNNLMFIVDRNNIQIDGFTGEVMPMEPLVDKLSSFGCRCMEIDGNNIEQIINVLKMDNSWSDQPVCVIARTIMGKGVEFMENKPEWHGKTPTIEQLPIINDQLNSKL